MPMAAHPDPEHARQAAAVQAILGRDRYRIRGHLGSGGMATVWLADDAATNRPVAVKALKPEHSRDPEFRQRFRNEASAARAVRSPNSVTVLDYRESADACLIIMEYIRGESVADVLRRMGTIPEHLAVDVVDQAAHGLSAVHAAGLVHRDIKPANMLVTPEGLVKITDFGIAKAAEDASLTRTGLVVGTAQYVSPEQARGEEVTPATDVYSLGCVAYEMLCGARPFTADSSVAVALAHINEAPRPLPPSVDPHVRELVGIMLRKDPARRYADGRELAAAVARVRAGRRPPQPAAAPPAVHRQAVAAYPATSELGAMTRPAAGPPAAPVPVAPVAPPAPARRPAPSRRQRRRAERAAKAARPARRGCLGCFGTLLVLAILLALAALVAAMVLAQGIGYADGAAVVWDRLVRGGGAALLDEAATYARWWVSQLLGGALGGGGG